MRKNIGLNVAYNFVIGVTIIMQLSLIDIDD